MSDGGDISVYRARAEAKLSCTFRLASDRGWPRRSTSLACDPRARPRRRLHSTVDIKATRMRRTGTRVAGITLANVAELEDGFPVEVADADDEVDVGVVDRVEAVDDVDVVLSISLCTPKI